MKVDHSNLTNGNWCPTRLWLSVTSIRQQMLRHCPLVSHESLPSPQWSHEPLTFASTAPVDMRPPRPWWLNFDPWTWPTPLKAWWRRRAAKRKRLMTQVAVYRSDVIDQLSPVRVTTNHWPFDLWPRQSSYCPIVTYRPTLPGVETARGTVALPLNYLWNTRCTRISKFTRGYLIQALN